MYQKFETKKIIGVCKLGQLSSLASNGRDNLKWRPTLCFIPLIYLHYQPFYSRTFCFAIMMQDHASTSVSFLFWAIENQLVEL